MRGFILCKYTNAQGENMGDVFAYGVCDLVKTLYIADERGYSVTIFYMAW